MPINIDKALGIFPQALTLRARRAEIIAANMANADTPNYKARDIDFKGALKQAADRAGSHDVTLRRTDARHLAVGGDAMSEAVKYRIPHQSSLDGNTVDAETEQAEFTRNAVQYQATLTFLNGRIRGLMTAIRGD
ncbi:MAG: flagellar basal body rod protein FlgB [Gammaproteobacteria bacterium]|nr:flagellar basal body rod protein FlgB [Gammaproteobacteria bacterium]